MTAPPAKSAVAVPGLWVSCRRCSRDEADTVLVAQDRMLAIPGEFHVVRCTRCGFMYTNPQPDAETLTRHYPASYPAFVPPPAHRPSRSAEGMRAWLRNAVLAARGYPVTPPPRAARAGRLLSAALAQRFVWLPEFVPGGTLLEIGCATGPYIAEMRELGWNVIGVEPDESAARAARENLGLDVRTGTLEGSELPADCCDVVVMRMVLEHVPDPRATLAEAGRVLAPGGRLLISVPNAASIEARVFGDRWSAWDLPRHLSHFTPRTLAALLESCGFVVEAVHHLVNANNIATSLRYVSGRVGLASPWQARALLPLAAVQAAVRRSGRLAVAARRPGAGARIRRGRS